MNFNKLTLTIFLCFFVMISVAQNIKEGELLVMLKNKVSVIDFCEQINKFNPTLNLEIKEVISKRINVWVLEYNSTSYSPNSVLEMVQQQENVEISQFNHTNITNREDSCAKDPLFASQQWNLNNTGQSGGVVGADIDACRAWGITTNTTTAKGDSLVVAVIDEGFYLPHSDLNFFKNYNDIPGNGIDDDGNGYVDDTLGWNAFTDSNNIQARSHGTQVSGVVGAKANNGIGISGVSWGMKILPIGHGGSGLESVILKAYGYALEMRALYDSSNGTKGAFIVATNSSFGINYGRPNDYPLWCAFYDSLGKYGILSVAATSNSNTNVDVDGDIPTTCTSDFLITVTSTDRNDSKVINAGYGLNSIDIGAPGQNITTTTNGNGYFSPSGTSVASPHLAGAVGFMYAAACKEFIDEYSLYPDSMALLIKKIILENGDSIPSLLGLTVSGQRLNLYKAAKTIRTDYLCRFTSIDEDKEIDESSVSLYPNPNKGDFNLKFENFKAGKYTYSIVDLSGKLVAENQIDLTGNTRQTSVNIISGIDKGIYILCLKSNFNLVKSVKFVKFVVTD